jgi:hypothetical protein
MRGSGVVARSGVIASSDVGRSSDVIPSGARDLAREWLEHGEVDPSLRSG